MKTILAPGFKARLLGMNGWYSTNILGNRDGEVLDDPESFKTKEVSKLGVLEHILQPELYPDLYGKIHHVVRINYYPPRGDNKEGWDNIDIFGWMGYPMQIKVDFLCRDSILAAPIVLDLAIFSDLAKRSGMSGHPGVAVVLLQEPADGPGPLPRARPLHPADEAQEHAAPPARRRADHAPRPRVLRLGREAEPAAGSDRRPGRIFRRRGGRGSAEGRSPAHVRRAAQRERGWPQPRERRRPQPRDRPIYSGSQEDADVTAASRASLPFNSESLPTLSRQSWRSDRGSRPNETMRVSRHFRNADPALCDCSVVRLGCTSHVLH